MRLRGHAARRMLAVLLLVTTGCSSGSSGSTASDRPQRLRILAAASLGAALGAARDSFVATRPGVEVEIATGGSSALVEQLAAGAPADVLVTADEVTMARARANGDVGNSVVIARNRLALIVAAGNPEQLRSLADLTKPRLVLVLCAPEVPCGRLARLALDRAGVSVTPRGVEPDVKGVVAKVALGEADAGLVYVTDALAAAADTDTVPIDVAANPALEAVYPAAVTTASEAAGLARDFVDHLLGPTGQAALAELGFRPA